jgi:protein TonB
VYVDGGFRYLETTTLYALSTAPPLRIRVGGKVQGAALIHKVSPRYPAEARARRVEGTVRLQVVVSRDGTIQDVKVLLSGDSALAAAAVEAVREWRYRPTLLNGLPVEVLTTIDLNFVLGR